MGDFFELFDDDAEIVARELEIALTRRDFGRGEKSPMAGIPHHAVDGYIARLVSKGYRVAVCEQTSDPALSKGLVDREVIRIVTPGTVIDPAMLAAKRNNFLAGVVTGRDAVGIAYADIPDLDEEDEDDIAPLTKLLTGVAGHVTPYDARYFTEDDARHRLLTHFEIASLEGLGCAHLPHAIRAAGAVLAYLQETQKGLLQHLTALETYYTNGFMTLDSHTRRNLELFETGRSGSVKGSLLWVLDKTRSPMGGRLMRRWISQPLLDISILEQRQQVISELLGNTLLQARLVEALKKAGDIERLTNRVRQRIASPRDLVALASGLRAADEVRSSLPENAAVQMPSLVQIMRRLSNNDDIITLIESAIVDEPPLSTSEGGVIRPGFSDELDQIKHASKDGQKWMAELEQRERRRTGINNLKVGYNKGPGYYIEVSNANANRVPKDYIRKQTLTNC